MRLSIHLGVQIASLIDEAGSKPAPWVSAQDSPEQGTLQSSLCRWRQFLPHSIQTL